MLLFFSSLSVLQARVLRGRREDFSTVQINSSLLKLEKGGRGAEKFQKKKRKEGFCLFFLVLVDLFKWRERWIF
uniref:Uncharacterized protein n=1 Tax=Nelumbo nucifera TaxID=4432 RepID=A0A822YNB1_NELNU|nr:TPA_asm: hypothetical protein HUJ06_006304 [Nelumbo nucifera]